MRYEVDEQVPVLFDPTDPYRAEINAFIPLWGGAIIMLAMGACFSWFGFYMLGCHRRALRVVARQAGRSRGAQGEMIACPSCGFSQPATTICAVCRTDIARYREKLAYAENFSARFSGKVAMVRNIIVIVSIIAGVYTLAGQMKAFMSSSGGKQVPVPWTDSDHRYEFMISVDLQVRSNKDVVADYPLLKSKPPTMYQLVVISAAAPATVIALGISGITIERLKSVGWDGIASEIGSEVKVVVRDEVECHGLTLHRIGYETGGGYREDAYFESGKHVIQVSLASTSGENSLQTARAREVIMNSLSGI
jgi:hypothetical protein